MAFLWLINGGDPNHVSVRPGRIHPPSRNDLVPLQPVGIKSDLTFFRSLRRNVFMIIWCQGLNSHYFPIIGDGHQPNSRG